MKVVPVILAGGIGERFWPLSRTQQPKQLLQLISKKSMMEETYSRVQAFQSRGVKPLIVTSKSIASKIKKLFSDPDTFDYIVEPVGKNTAPAIALAAQWIRCTYGDDSIMVVLPADHAIKPQKEFSKAVKYAISNAASRDSLVVFGIKPSRPDTGYGYILLDKQIDSDAQLALYDVKRFVEKPDVKTARKYCDSGKYLWNSGMFIWKVSVILEEFAAYMPDIHDAVVKAGKAKFSTRAIGCFYEGCVKESIDYGIMERSRRVCAVRPDFQWDDVGSWDSLGRILPVNERGTVVSGAVYEQECSNSIIANHSSHPVAAIGLDNAVVVAVDDALLVISRDRLPDLKKYLGELKKNADFKSDLF